MWSAEKRAEGLEYMHPKPSSHSGRIVGDSEVILSPDKSNNRANTRLVLYLFVKRVSQALGCRGPPQR